MNKVSEDIHLQLEQKGYKSRIVSLHHLKDLQQEINAQLAQRSLNEEFFRERLSFFEFNPHETFPDVVSIIIIAFPRPQHKVGFVWNNRTLNLILPPTYVGYGDIPKQIENQITIILTPLGYRVFPARLPLKALAVRSGLADYGRNNLSYIRGLGSFFQLAAFYSDLPCEEDHYWREPHMMEICQKCTICLRKCPTLAIIPDRFLIRAERCLTFHNERGPEYPFPGWIEAKSHNSLIGCMSCQRFCPANEAVINWVEGDIIFDQDETRMILGMTPLENMPVTMIEKLKQLDLQDSLEILPRNLGIFT